jgi:predicted transcriptional regulator
MGDKQVSDVQLLDMNAEQVGELIDNLTSEPVSTPGEEAQLLASLPAGEPDAPMNVVTSLRLPADLKRRLDAAAAGEDISPSTFIRRAIESALAGRDKGNLVNLEDVIRAIKSVPHAA